MRRSDLSADDSNLVSSSVEPVTVGVSSVRSTMYSYLGRRTNRADAGSSSRHNRLAGHSRVPFAAGSHHSIRGSRQASLATPCCSSASVLLTSCASVSAHGRLRGKRRQERQEPRREG